MPQTVVKISYLGKLASKVRRSWNDNVKSPLNRSFERFHRRPEIIERGGAIRNIPHNPGLEDQKKKEVPEKPLDEKEAKQTDEDSRITSIRDMSEKVSKDPVAERMGRNQPGLEAERPDLESLITELREQAAEQRELLNSLFQNWRNDAQKYHEETIAAVRQTASEQVPFNLQGYLDEFSRALALDVRQLLGEVGKLREERRALHFELSFLLSMKYKYGAGGEFEPEWHPPPSAPWGPPSTTPPHSPGAPRDSPTTSTKPGWRSVPQNESREKEAPRPTAGPSAPSTSSSPAPDSNKTFQSWATFQPKPNSSPLIRPTILVPDYDTNPGLFGPRSRRNSSHSEGQ